ncbi:ABC transporter substrate-binding protein [Cohnella fermenti]|uniref:Extracellular solute-binding protein n=1 Tax=Cohnella fermenti TaxID=2565925 RepID=A0A4S4CBL3_9BACL|nr:extracellular solute-binding protein [Cohnella fermenti]THF83276.1 extracellular solute-binding protein [Cohnella fermenti]
MKRLTGRRMQAGLGMGRRLQMLGLAGLLGLCAGVLSSCGKTGSVAEPQADDTTHIVYISNEEVGSSVEMIRQLSAEYEAAHPSVSLAIEAIPEGDLSQRITLLAASNDLPTMFRYQSGRPLLDLIRSDAVLDLEGTFKELGLYNRLNPAAVELLKNAVDGAGLYALPLEMNIEGFWYNKAIFAEYGLEEPQTWDDMLQVAGKLKAAGVQPFSVAGKDKWQITRLINGYAIRKLGVDAMERVDKGELKLTEASFVEAAAVVQSMGLKGYLGGAVNTLDVNAATDLFLQGKAAMYYSGSWMLRDFNVPERNGIGADNIGFFSVPLVEGGAGSLDEYPMNAGLTTSFSKEAYTEEVGEWMKDVFAGYGDRAMSELGLVTGFRVESMPENVPPLTRMVQERIGQVTKASGWFEAKFGTKATLLAWNNAQLLVTSAKFTPERYMAELQAVLDSE